MSYRADAEINDCSYGCLFKKSEKESEINFRDKMRHEFETRENRAIWFVSNCDADFRLKFALNLEKHYPIKINGNCEHRANLIRMNINNYFLTKLYDFVAKFKNLFTKNSNICKPNSKCELDQFSSNKFYLSFESKNCSNYITEKLWKILRTNMIPIVVQPNKMFYELIAPIDSFIHAQDFDYDAGKLGIYLKQVESDFDLYIKHHRWRLDYDVSYTQFMSEKRRMCEVCTKLNTETSSIFYKKVSTWFERNCEIN